MKTIRNLALTALLAAPVVALAANAPSSSPGVRAACKADAEKLCPSVQPGGGRIAACLKQNDAQVSAACKEARANAHARKAPAAPTPPAS